MSGSSPDLQAPVDRYFDASADYWNAVYGGRDLQGLIYRRRMQTAVAWTRELGLAAGAAALDVGCGAGLMVVQLAQTGFSVTGTDSSPGMVRSARELVAAQRLAAGVALRQADVHRLPFGDREFQLVVALGLLPWLHDPSGAVIELGRVLAPGGWIIVTADNRHRLNRLTEPRENPLLLPLRPVKRTLWPGPGDRSERAHAHRHLPGEVDEMLARAGISITRRATIGYGPFTMLGRPLLPDRIGTQLHERLERAAVDRPRLRGGGWHYLVAGHKVSR